VFLDSNFAGFDFKNAIQQIQPNNRIFRRGRRQLPFLTGGKGSARQKSGALPRWKTLSNKFPCYSILLDFKLCFRSSKIPTFTPICWNSNSCFQTLKITFYSGLDSKKSPNFPEHRCFAIKYRIKCSDFCTLLS
jgi:hypothetical protein